MRLEESILFVPKQELLLPFDAEADSEMAVEMIHDYKGGFFNAPVGGFGEVLRVNFHFGIELDLHPDGSEDNVHITNMEGARMPLIYEDEFGNPAAPDSTDGMAVRGDVAQLIVVGASIVMNSEYTQATVVSQKYNTQSLLQPTTHVLTPKAPYCGSPKYLGTTTGNIIVTS